MNKILIFTCCIFLFSCSQKQAETNTTTTQQDTASNIVMLTNAQLKNAGIETGKPEMRSMPLQLKVNGLIDVPPEGMVTVSFPLGGYVKSTELLPGMHIRKGQTLAVMQDPSFVQMQEDYLMAKTKLSFLQKEAERQKLLNTTKATSDKVYEQTISDYESQKVLVSALRQKLLLIGIQPDGLTDANISSTVAIPSPISGYVSSVNVNVGKYVNPSDVLFELVNTSDLHLALTIFQKDLPHIHSGQKVQAYLTSDTTKMYPAEIILVGKTLDSNRSATVHCHFIGAEPPLLPGMFMNAQVQVSNTNSIVVPEDAIVRSGSEEYVFVEKDSGQFEMTPVQTIVSGGGFVALSSDNNSLINKTIIKKNAYSALMKLKNTGEEEE
ncbi:efflux RND transporter periplasmic adaptor subunit [Ilyomonas limi]|uniref:Efflux RND transporter periplasmic adaptor subunit n=1 Tax=Ilyomonas limi TaxID=2575867 RepID=A0A4V5UV43_9BACT|nr:efflux RND transporter periplasmic adaptor subunit [Ilyomonas limi]TKK71633.1 efflux RND transporter periplasmic adaptor subunit [Ilyomonas limi]